ncbi:glycosyltransferase family A protein [Halorubrum sp. SP9]|uniref:glycosyltransferase family 2 protein n=1 Tax=Halorubrum sp. SP9 TaxID=1537267 RepID=UPI0010F90735|nr:glycosyltransferase family A protein [Halorubrum sp. SP9]TKX71527.1 glycosyltransferase family 2 protein [Halorubrum sp. SP9]
METRDRPLVSAVVITRDRPAKLADALASVRAQTYPNLELVVVDGSDEPVESLVRRRAGDRPVTYRRDDGEGPGAARNIGIRAASGEYVAFLDDDDRWLPEKAERQVAAFEPGVAVVYTGQFAVRDGERVGGRSPSLSGDVTEALLRGVPCAPTSTVMVRRATIDDAGAFDEGLPIWEDREWYVRLSEHGEFRPVPEKLVQRGIGEYDQLTDDFEAARDVAYPRFLDAHRERAAEYGAGCERMLVASLSRKLGATAMENGLYGEARRWLARSLRHEPGRRRTWVYLLVSLGGAPAWRGVRRLRRTYRSLTSRGTTTQSPDSCGTRGGPDRTQEDGRD